MYSIETGPKVTVCVITYNQEDFIEECLESILNQNVNFDFEIIVGDDDSCDNTRAIIEKYAIEYPGIIKPIFLTKNSFRGCENYRQTHSSARGEYVAHIDGDDYMLPGKLAKQVAFLDGNPQCSMVAHKALTLLESGKSYIVPLLNQPKTNDVKRLLNRGLFFVNSSKMYRRDLCRDLKSITQSIFLDFSESIEMGTRGKIGYINEALVTYRKRSGSITDVHGERLYYLIDLTLKGFDDAPSYGIKDNIVCRAKSKYLCKAAIELLRREDSYGFEKYIRIYDEIPKHKRAFIPEYILGGGYGGIRKSAFQFILALKRFVLKIKLLLSGLI